MSANGLVSGKPYRGIEKNIFYRICDLLALNVHLLFVFDSPQRPPKRARRHGTRLNPNDTKDLRQVLDAFCIPYHQAKGEAEVEYVRLQQLGIVDAVWSQDSDCLLFGCDLLIHDNRVTCNATDVNRSKGNTKKDSSTVKVVRGSEIRDKHGMDRDGLLLFALLCGGDFNPQGLKNCGPTLAVRAVRDGIGKGLSICRTQEDCLRRSGKLLMWMDKQENNRHVQVALDFPDIQILKMYNEPLVYSDIQLGSLDSLRQGWDRPINELALFEITGPFFNIWGKGYLGWISPVLLTRSLVARNPSLPLEDMHKIQLVNRRATRGAGQASQPSLSMRKVRFSPFGLTSLDRRHLEREWTSQSSTFDPNFVVESEIPIYLLERALPPESFDRTKKATKPRESVPCKGMSTEKGMQRHRRARGPPANPSLSARKLSSRGDCRLMTPRDIPLLHSPVNLKAFAQRLLNASTSVSYPIRKMKFLRGETRHQRPEV